jgi:hypothetical protein
LAGLIQKGLIDFRLVFRFELFPLDGRFFPLSHALRLKQIQRQRDADMKSLTTKAATDRVLQEGQARDIGETYSGGPELWRSAIGAVHSKTYPSNVVKMQTAF